jgi:non-heme chloroperoxidase
MTAARTKTSRHRGLRATSLLGIALWSAAHADPAPWRDPSPHRIKFVTVAPDVQLETLDWGGRGRPIVLLAGGGNTAHVFDDFAQKLIDRYHVYGITRRGSPPSSVPDDGYSGDRMGDDVLAAIDALRLKQPVLVGHSFAGQEMSNVATRYPERVAAVIYLDAMHSWDAEYEAQGFYRIFEWKQQLDSFQGKFNELVSEPWDSRPLAKEMLTTNIPQLQTMLETLTRIENGRPPRPNPTPADLADFTAVQAWYARGAKVTLPESELRMMLATDDAGRPTMKRRRPPLVGQKLDAGKQEYTNVPVPALGIYAVIDDPGSANMQDPEQRANAEAYQWFQRQRAERSIALFRRDLPQAQLIRIERADHYVFLSNEGEVLRGMNAFIAKLPR